MKKNLFCLLLLFVPLFFCAAQIEEGLAGRLSSISSALSAAHISLAPGTRIRVTNLETGRSIAVIVSRRLSADSTHLVELTAPVAEAIGMRDEAWVRVELLNSGGTSATAPGSPAASGSSQAGTGTAESRDSRETAAGQGRRGSVTEGTPREPAALPPVRVSQARPEAVNEQETETEDEDKSQEFYYVNSYEGEYPGDPEDPEPPLSWESGPSQGDIVTLSPETDQSAPPPPATPPARRRPVPPPPADPPPPEQTQSVPPAATPSPPRPAPPVQPQSAPPAATPSPPRPAPPVQPQSAPPAATLSPPRPAQSVAPPVQPRPAPPAPPPERGASPPPPVSSPQPGPGTASARVALPADTDRVVLSMSRDESGKLWVYVESETAREIAVTEVPRPAPIQTPVPDQAQPRTVPRQAPPPAVPRTAPPQVQAPPPAPPYQVQTPPAQVQPSPPPPPPPAPQRRQVTVTVIPRLPPPGDGKRYILQVGSYRDRGTAEYRLFNLQNAGIDAVMEPHDGAIRIIINDVYAEEIPALAEKLGKAGITEIWVRQR